MSFTKKNVALYPIGNYIKDKLTCAPGQPGYLPDILNSIQQVNILLPTDVEKLLGWW